MATAVLYTVVGFVITAVVWLLGHCFDVLALISPFPFVDFVLKAIRNTIFAVLLGASIVSPHVGLVLRLVVIVASFLLFGWALRLAFFGTLYAMEPAGDASVRVAGDARPRRASTGLQCWREGR